MPNCWKYDYDDTWIVENYPGKCTKAFYLAYCERTGYIGNIEVLRKHCRSLNVNKAPWKSYTTEMDNWLIENYPKLGRIPACKKFKEVFKLNYSINSISEYARNKLNLKVDRNVAYNNRHKFTENQTSYLYKDGEIRDDGGYTVIKINGKWYSYRRYLWEKEYGKVPKGYRITYLDDPYDFSMDNTVCVPEKYITLLTSHNLRANNKTITRCGIKWCELYYTAKKKGVY